MRKRWSPCVPALVGSYKGSLVSVQDLGAQANVFGICPSWRRAKGLWARRCKPMDKVAADIPIHLDHIQQVRANLAAEQILATRASICSRGEGFEAVL